MRIPSGVTDQYIYFVAVDSTDFTTRETGLSSFTVYRSRNGGTAAAMTTPTINETDATNMPGVYELLLDEDMTIDSGDDSQEMVFHITQASMAPVTRTIELYRPKITAGNTLGVASDGDVSGNVDGNVVGSVASVTGAVGSVTGAVGSVTAGVTLANGAVTDASLAGNMEIVFETDFATNYNTTDNAWVTNGTSFIGTGWNTGKTGYSLTATTGLGNQTANITGNLSGSVGSVTGAVGSVTGAVGSVTGSVGSISGVTFPTNFGDLSVTATTGRVDVASVAGTAQTAGDIPALVTTVDTVVDGIQTDLDNGTDGLGALLTAINAVDPALIASGTAQAGTGTTIQLAAASTFADDEMIGNIVLITGGTGVGQSNLITDYANATDTATVDRTWATNPDNTSTYKIYPLGAVALSAADIADAVWEEDITTHSSGSKAGQYVQDILTDTGTTIPGVLGTPAGADMSTDIAAIDTIVNGILPAKNTAFSDIEFLFVAASDHVTPVTSASGTAVTRSIDGGAFGSGTGTLAEVGNGIYQYDASAADMNGTVITFRFTGTGGTPGAPDDVFLTVKTTG